MLEKIGQINRGTFLGDKIYELTKQNDVKEIIDEGSWNSLGTTKCIIDAILDSGKRVYDVYSIECNESRWNEGKINLMPVPSHFHQIHGSLVTVDELKTYREIITEQPYRSYLEEDIIHVSRCPYVFDMMPEKIDLLIIDGGEFSGETVFRKLYKRSKYIILDDTLAFKNKSNRQFILDNKDDFEIIYDDIILKGQMVVKNLKF